MTSHLASSLASSRSNNSNPNNQTSSSKPTTDEAIVQNLFSKVAQIIVDARVISNSSSNSNNSNNSSSNKEKENSGVKSNKWFNLDTVDVDPLRGELKFWKTMIAQISSQSQQQQQQQQHTQMQPLILDIYLDISDLYSTSQHLVLKDEVSLRRHKVPHEYLVGSSMDPITGTSFDVKKKRILLESWQLTLLQPPPRSPPETPVMYKKCVMFFRSLYTHIRLLPSYRLHRRLAKTDRDQQQQQPPFRIGYRLSSSRVLPVDEAGLGDTLLPAPTTTTQSSSFTMKQQHLQHHHPLQQQQQHRQLTSEYNFGSLETSIGTVCLHVMYRVDCDFTVSDPMRPIVGGGSFNHGDEYAYSSASSSVTGGGNVNRRISAPVAGGYYSGSPRSNTVGPFASSGGGGGGGGGMASGRPSILSSSPRSFGAAGTRTSLPNALAYQQYNIHGGGGGGGGGSMGPPPPPPVVIPKAAGSMAGGVSPAFTLSGSFPRSFTNTSIRSNNNGGGGRGGGEGKSGLADAIAMGLFDGAQRGLPFSVKQSGDENGTTTAATAEAAARQDAMDSDRKSLEDIFSGMEESPPFNVFLSKDVGKFPKYGTSVSSNHSNTSTASLTQRQSITFPRSHGTNAGGAFSQPTTIPFTNTILHRGNHPKQPSLHYSNSSATSTAIVSRNGGGGGGSGIPIIPGSTPPRHNFSTSLSKTQPLNPYQLISAASATTGFGAQTPPPFVTMTNLGGTVGRRVSSELLGGLTGASYGSSAGGASLVHHHNLNVGSAGSVASDIGDFLKSVEGRRKSLLVNQRRGITSGSAAAPLDASDSSSNPGQTALVVASAQKKKAATSTNKTASLLKFSKLKDSYHEFSDSLTVATGGSADIMKPRRKVASISGSGTPPPVTFSSSPPVASLGGSMSHNIPSISSGTSPKSDAMGIRAHSPLIGEPFTNPLVSTATPGSASLEKQQKQYGVRRAPSSLQQVTVLSTVMSESGSGDSVLVGVNSGPVASNAVISAGSPITEESPLASDLGTGPSGTSLDTRDRNPQKPPPLVLADVPSVVANDVSRNSGASGSSNAMRRHGKPQRGNVFTGENPARVSSGFFPVGGERSVSDRTSWSGGPGMGRSDAHSESHQRNQTPFLAIEALGIGGTSGGSVGAGGIVAGPIVATASSLSTSLRSTAVNQRPAAHGPADGGVGSTPSRALSAERPLQVQGNLSRRNSSGGNLVIPPNQVASGGTVAANSEGGGSSGTGRVGKMGARFGSAPVEVPFAKRVGSEHQRRVDHAWDHEEDEDDE